MENNYCMFCGQTILPGEECKCTEAKIDRAKKKQFKDAILKIEIMFNDLEPSTELLRLLNECVEAVLNGIVKKQTIIISESIKLDISISSDGNLKINRTDTIKSSEQVKTQATY